MRVRINGWQRIGIIPSVVWAVTGYIWRGAVVDDRNMEFASTADKVCLEYPHADKDCMAEFFKNYRLSEDANPPKLEGAIFGLVPIPLAWLIAYALIGLWRWIRRGFST